MNAGLDRHSPARRDSYGSTMAEYRSWLPQQVAENIASGNAERLFKR